MSNDVAKFDTATGFVHDIWKGPIELVVLGWFIYREIGVAGLIGIAFLLSFIPLQGKLEWRGTPKLLTLTQSSKRPHTV